MTPPAAGRSAAEELLSAPFREASYLQELRGEFAHRGYVKLTGLFEQAVSAAIAAEAQRLEPTARPRRFLMDGYATPRVLSTLGGARIAQQSTLLASLYDHAGLRSTLEQIIGSAVYSCQHREEFMVLNYLRGVGTTHGWHLDDPAYALVQVIEAPPPEQGGILEFIPDWRRHCQAAAALPEVEVERTIARGGLAALIEQRILKSGDIYLMRADSCLHRVSELTAPAARRVVLNLAFEQTPCPRYGHTATLLYAE